MRDYTPQALDRKWQARWAETGAFEVTEDPSKPKFYCLEMFAYPSGHAHVGHVRNYMIGDVMARQKRMRGFNVLHPFGWDAFGLPAENAAIKQGVHPETSTFANIAHMKGQLQRLGISYAWSRELATCQPDYYKWNQWLFLRMYERGLAYRKRSTVNWCPSCRTVLANEQVVDGACWRCGSVVGSRNLEQWFLRITHYAQELLDATARLTDWPEKVLTMQRNWIGRSEGARVKFPLLAAGISTPASGPRPADATDIEVFTTRIDTIYGATFVLLAPEHDFIERIADESEDPAAFRERVQRFRAQDRTARLTGAIEKEGFFTGRYAVNPFTGLAGAPLRGELRPRRVRHRRRDGRPCARPARLRVRPKVRAADHGRDSAGRRGRDGALGGHDGRGVRRAWSRRGFGRVLRAVVDRRDPRRCRTPRRCAGSGRRRCSSA